MANNILSESIRRHIEEEIGAWLDREDTIAEAHGYYCAWAEIIRGIQRGSNSVEEYTAFVVETVGYVSPANANFSGAGLCAEDIPIVLLAEHLEHRCREALLPETDDPAYAAVEVSISGYDWSVSALSLEQDFCDPCNC